MLRPPAAHAGSGAQGTGRVEVILEVAGEEGAQRSEKTEAAPIFPRSEWLRAKTVSQAARSYVNQATGSPARVSVGRGATAVPGQASLNAMPVIEAAAAKGGPYGPVSLGSQILDIGPGSGEGQGAAGPAGPGYGSTLTDDPPGRGQGDQSGRSGRDSMGGERHSSPPRTGPASQDEFSSDPVSRTASSGTQAQADRTARADRATAQTPSGQGADLSEAPTAAPLSTGRTGPEAVVPGPQGSEASSLTGAKAETIQAPESLVDRQGTVLKGPDSVGIEATGLRNGIGSKGGPALAEAGTSKSGQEAALRDEILSQVADRAKILTEEGGGSVRIRLQPESLGTLRVEITVRDGVVSARIITDNLATRGLIESGSTELRDALQAQDLKIEKFGVFVGREGSGGQTALLDGRSENRSGGPQERGSHAPSPEWTGETEEQPHSPPRRRDGLIDLLA